ncbi:unnamed protein product [Calypogeia fissa]
MIKPARHPIFEFKLFSLSGTYKRFWVLEFVTPDLHSVCVLSLDLSSLHGELLLSCIHLHLYLSLHSRAIWEFLHSPPQQRFIEIPVSLLPISSSWLGPSILLHIVLSRL